MLEEFPKLEQRFAVCKIQWDAAEDEEDEDEEEEEIEKRYEVRRMHFKAVKFETKATDDGVFEGYASVFDNIDAYNDIVEKGAFRKTIAENRSRIKVLWQHDASEPIGIPIAMEEDDKGLYVKYKISDTEAGKKAKILIQDGVVTEMSIGYDVVKDDYKMLGTKRVRLLKELKLWEFSPVTFAANDMAKILAVKTLIMQKDYDTMEKVLAYAKSLLETPAAISTGGDHIEPTEILEIIKKLKGSE
jgi:HK97 family phage prohead protease